VAITICAKPNPVAGSLCEAPTLACDSTRAMRRPQGGGYRPVACLTARRRRMLEDGCAEKRRFDTLRSQRRNFRKLKSEIGRADDYRMRSMIIAARRNQGNCTSVIAAIRVRVKASMQIGRAAQHKCPEKPCENEHRDKCAPAICWTREDAHCAASFSPLSASGKKFLHEDTTPNL
jgi:hypothetical protein